MPNAVTGSSATIVARPVANMDASGQAGLITLEQVSVSVAYDDLYERTLSAADSTKLVNAFTVGGKGATFSAILSSSADFEDVLTRNMASALLATAGNTIANSYTEVGVDLSGNLYNELLTQFKHVFEDTLPNILQSDWSLSNSVNYAGGASNMAGLIVPTEAEILAQQIPESNYELYSAMDVSEEMTTAALPLKGTDSIIFVFDVKLGAVIRTAKKTAGTNASASTESASAGAPGSTGTGAYGAAINSVTYAYNSRAVAFKFTVKNDAESAGKLDGVKAVSA
jgi:hypothetical protein